MKNLVIMVKLLNITPFVSVLLKIWETRLGEGMPMAV